MGAYGFNTNYVPQSNQGLMIGTGVASALQGAVETWQKKREREEDRKLEQQRIDAYYADKGLMKDDETGEVSYTPERQAREDFKLHEETGLQANPHEGHTAEQEEAEKTPDRNPQNFGLMGPDVAPNNTKDEYVQDPIWKQAYDQQKQNLAGQQQLQAAELQNKTQQAQINQGMMSDEARTRRANNEKEYMKAIANPKYTPKVDPNTPIEELNELEGIAEKAGSIKSQYQGTQNKIGERTYTDQEKALGELSKDKNYVKLVGSAKEADTILGLIDDATDNPQTGQKGNPESRNALAPYLARYASGGQRINKEEMHAMGEGSKAITDHVGQIYKDYQNGTLSPENAAYMKRFIAVTSQKERDAKEAMENDKARQYAAIKGLDKDQTANVYRTWFNREAPNPSAKKSAANSGQGLMQEPVDNSLKGKYKAGDVISLSDGTQVKVDEDGHSLVDPKTGQKIKKPSGSIGVVR